MYCKKCGTKIEDGICICPQCGTVVQPEEAKRKPTNKLIMAIAMVAVVAIASLLIGLFAADNKNPGYNLKNEWGISHDELVKERGDEILFEKDDGICGQNPTITGFEKDVIDVDGKAIYFFDESGLYKVIWLSTNSDSTYAKIPDIVKKYNKLFGKTIDGGVLAGHGCAYRWKTEKSDIMVTGIIGEDNGQNVMIEYTEINHADN